MLTPEQIESHNRSITGSKVGVILSVSPFQSRYGLWAEMTGLVERVDVSTERMRFGNYAEHMIDQIVEHEFGWTVEPGPAEGKTQEKYPMFYGLIDRFRTDCEPRRVLEYKNIDRIQLPAWEDEGPPAYYEAQCRFYSILWKMPCTLVAVFGGNTVRTYDFERDEQVEAYIIRECLKFWDMVQNMEAPPVDGKGVTTTALAKLYPGNKLALIDGDGSAEELIRRRELFSAVEKRAKERKEAYSNELKSIIGEHEGILCASGIKATWKKTKDGVTFDEKRFADENPKLYEKYIIPKPGHRRFLCNIPKKLKEIAS